MKRLSTTQRLLGGVLLALVAFWLFDRFTGSSRPATAKGKPASTETASTKSVEWLDVSDRVARLTHPEYVSVESDVDELTRDLFVPVAEAQQALATTAAPADPPAPPAEPAPAVSGFDTRHKLAGVIIGHNALAVIDDRLLGLGAVLDGHKLVEVRRDYVVFREIESGNRVTLLLQQRPETP